MYAPIIGKIISWIWFIIPKEVEVLEVNTVNTRFEAISTYAAATIAAAIALASLGMSAPIQFVYSKSDPVPEFHLR